MRFLVDECLSIRLAPLLAGAGHDAVHVTDRGLEGRTGHEVLATAAAEGRVLLSADTDFGEILARSNDATPRSDARRTSLTRPGAGIRSAGRGGDGWDLVDGRRSGVRRRRPRLAGGRAEVAVADGRVSKVLTSSTSWGLRAVQDVVGADAAPGDMRLAGLDLGVVLPGRAAPPVDASDGQVDEDGLEL